MIAVSTEKCHNGRRLIVAILAALPLCFCLKAGGQEANPILAYYCRQASAACNLRSLTVQQVNYSFMVTVHRTSLGRRGEVTGTDSAACRYFFTGAALDSQRAAAPASDDMGPLDFSCPNVFDVGYQYQFFPNDTGGTLAIGFDSDSLSDTVPNGLAIIDRYDFALQRLYLFYPNKPGYKRYTRILYMGKHGGYLLPDSIAEQGSKTSILSTEHYRLKLVISEVKIYR